MKKLLPIFVLLFAVTGCKNEPSANRYSDLSTPMSYQDSELTKAARGVVGFDDDGIAPSPNDERVKRAEIVLASISKEFNEPPINAGFGADLSVKYFEETYKKKILRLQVLEDFWKFYSTADEKTKKNVKSQSIKDSIRLFAILKYK
jgi:hypothetical protein